MDVHRYIDSIETQHVTLSKSYIGILILDYQNARISTLNERLIHSKDEVFL